MKYSEKDRLKKIMIMLAENWTKEISKDLQNMWWIALNGYGIETIADACQILIKERKKEKGYPAPADIIDIIKTNRIIGKRQLPPPVEPPLTEIEVLFFRLNIRFCQKLINERRYNNWTKNERDMFLIENSDGVFNAETIAECERLSNNYPDHPKFEDNKFDSDIKDLIGSIMGKRTYGQN